MLMAQQRQGETAELVTNRRYCVQKQLAQQLYLCTIPCISNQFIKDNINLRTTHRNSSDLDYNRFDIQMKKVVIKEELEKGNKLEEEKEESEDSQELADEPQELNFVPKLRKKEAMFVTYSGIFESGSFNFSHSLTLLYTTVTSPHWKVAYGQKSGISQNATHNGKQIVWNFPFEMTFETTNPQGWPQMVVVIYSKDFMGRTCAKGYGNIHLPTAVGQHIRKLKIFETIAPSTAANCCAFLLGYINELKQPEKVLLEADGGRECLQTRLNGQITMRLEARKYNFEDYGYE